MRFLVILPRKKNVWIFGAWSGTKYSDNSKYLFEYVSEYENDITAIWITRNIGIECELTGKGYLCYTSHSLAGFYYRLIGGVFLYTNGMRDFGVIDLSWGGVVVALWHGMPIKKMQYEANFYTRKAPLLRILTRFKGLLYSHHRRKLTLATSERAATFLTESYNIKSSGICLSVQPREDFLIDGSQKVSLKERIGLSSSERIILFMPTWRDNIYWNEFYIKLVQELLNDHELNDELAAKNNHLLISLHPRMQVGYLSGLSNICVMDKETIDSQELLAVADELVSDYSSALIDFAITDKTIHIFAPDIEDYINGNNGLFIHPDKYCKLILKSREDLHCVFREAHHMETSVSTMLNAIYRDKCANLYSDKGCQTVFNRVKQLQGCE